MKRIVVDTNIVFSALQSRNSETRRILDRQDLHFFTVNFLLVEIFRHKARILKSSKVTEEEVYEILYKTLSKINFVAEEAISSNSFVEAYRLCRGVDEKDTPFVALALELDQNCGRRMKS